VAQKLGSDVLLGVYAGALLGSLARGTFPRQRAFRRWQRGQPEAWVSSDGRQTSVGIFPKFARTHTRTGAQEPGER
jgi:hypothetical protein